MARSKKYKIQVEFHEGFLNYPDRWRIYVWEKALFVGAYVGAEYIEHKPTPDEMESIGRNIIDEYLAKRDKEQGAVVNVRHP